MSVNYNATVETNRMIQVLNAIDAATPAGKVRIGTTGMATIIAQKTLQKPCGSVSGPTLTFFGFPETVAAIADGETVEADIVDGNNVVVVSGLTVGVVDADIITQNTNVLTGQPMTFPALSITHP